SKLKKWSTNRISKVCGAILRLSAAEMMYSPEEMDSVIINEAVEICKKFAGDNDYQFVNGVLGAISKELRDKK
ncbi:MAG: transcription antitermination factor NusB, partial [Oscillospiraceae bacterium]|nr:transcription antitermination factor NusB [Oscillospiraceae bacterium]